MAHASAACLHLRDQETATTFVLEDGVSLVAKPTQADRTPPLMRQPARYGMAAAVVVTWVCRTWL